MTNEPPRGQFIGLSRETEPGAPASTELAFPLDRGRRAVVIFDEPPTLRDVELLITFLDVTRVAVANWPFTVKVECAGGTPPGPEAARPSEANGRTVNPAPSRVEPDTFEGRSGGFLESIRGRSVGVTLDPDNLGYVRT